MFTVWQPVNSNPVPSALSGADRLVYTIVNGTVVGVSKIGSGVLRVAPHSLVPVQSPPLVPRPFMLHNSPSLPTGAVVALVQPVSTGTLNGGITAIWSQREAEMHKIRQDHREIITSGLRLQLTGQQTSPNFPSQPGMWHSTATVPPHSHAQIPSAPGTMIMLQQSTQRGSASDAPWMIIFKPPLVVPSAIPQNQKAAQTTAAHPQTFVQPTSDKTVVQPRKRGRPRGKTCQKPVTKKRTSVRRPLATRNRTTETASPNIRRKAGGVTDWNSSCPACSGKQRGTQIQCFHHRIVGELDDPRITVQDIPNKGRGLVVKDEFQAGEFVVEYSGKLLNQAQAEKKETSYAMFPEQYGSYMFFFRHRSKGFCIDATAETDRKGRLLNHGRSSANLRPEVIEMGDRPHIILRAIRRILPGEELLYDYGDRARESLNAFPWLKE